MQSRGGDKQGDMEEDHQPYQRPDTREEEDQSNAIHSTSVVATVDLEVHRPAGVSRGRSLQQRDGRNYCPPSRETTSTSHSVSSSFREIHAM